MNKCVGILGAVVLLATVSFGTSIDVAGAQSHEHSQTREIEIVVEGAYKPQRVEIHEGERVRLKFVRKDYGACTREVVFPKLNIKRELPTDRAVTFELPALGPGEYEFKCGMNMIKGVIVVLAHQH